MENHIKEGLPKGWVRDEVIRTKGINKGRIDIYVKSPSGRVFRLKKELASHIKEKNLPINLESFKFSSKKDHMILKTMDLDKSSSVSEIPVLHLIQTNNAQQDTDRYKTSSLVATATQTDKVYTSLDLIQELMGKNWISDITMQKWSEILQRANIKNVLQMRIKFVEDSPEVFEYPSESSFTSEMELNRSSSPLRDLSAHNSTPTLSGTSLTNYIPKLGQTEEFQLGITRSINIVSTSPTTRQVDSYQELQEVEKPVLFSAGTNSDILF